MIFYYPVISYKYMITIIALDLTSNTGFGWMLDYFTKIYGCKTAWDIILWCVAGCAVLAAISLAFTWKLKPKA